MQSLEEEKGIAKIIVIKNDFYKKFTDLLSAKNDILNLFREKMDAEKIKEIQDSIRNH